MSLRRTGARRPGYRAALALLGILAAAQAAFPSDKPDLDLPAQGEVFGALRRMQSRSGVLLPVQAFPQRESGLERGSSLDSAATPADAWLLDSRLHSRRSELVRWSDSARGHSFYLSPSFELATRHATGDGSSESGNLVGVGLVLSGNVFPRVSFHSRGSVYTEFTDRPQFTHQFSPEFGETYSVEKGAGDSLLPDRTFNRFEYYLLADLPWLTLKAGRDRLHMGPGYFSGLMATRDTPPYYMIEARLDFASWMTVDNYLLKMTDTRHEIQKYANLHRFEFKPTPRLAVAFQNMVIYQDRDPDWKYVVPLAPLAFSEDNLGGRDNDAMGFDFLYAGIPYANLWGELFIDDLLGPTAFFDDFWENRWAGLGGFQVVSPFPRWDADLVVEYSQVEPWTYLGRTPQSGFKHFNVPSASKLGPDSRSLDVQLSYRPFPWLELVERWESNDKGRGRQATLGVVHEDSKDGTSKSLLGGEADRERYLNHAGLIRWNRFFDARLAWRQGVGRTYGNEFGLSLGGRW